MGGAMDLVSGARRVIVMMGNLEVADDLHDIAQQVQEAALTGEQ